MSAPVLVGVDGSEASWAALDFAATEARLRRRPLLVFHSLVLPIEVSGVGTGYGSALIRTRVADTLRDDAQLLIDKALAHVAERDPDLAASGEVTESITPGSAIIERSRTCELIVIASHGRGGFTGLLLGSTSAQVAVYAACPVVVVRPRDAPPGPWQGRVVVGVDDRVTSHPALVFAFQEASRRAVTLVVVHVTKTGDPEFSFGKDDPLTEWRQRHPDVPVETVVETGKVRDVLRDLSSGAALLVVGSRGRGGFSGLLLGSTSQAMVHHARAPVAVVR